MKPAAAWPEGSLTSPGTGEPLRREGPFLVDAAGERWPVVEEIPYLRAGREDLRAEVCALLDRRDTGRALAELLRDQDDWAPDAPPTTDAALEAVAAAKRGAPAREAMSALEFGAVADYFTYRLSDPTYLAGLALIRAHWNAPRSAFELACGIGHYTRELTRRGVAAHAGDVVFAKLWLARRYLVPQSRLVCFDACRYFPLADGSFDLVLCQDAFYFLPDKPHAAAELRRISGEEGAVLVGHSHNAAVHNYSGGDPVGADEHARLLPGAELYDDDDLTRAALSQEAPRPRTADELQDSEAICAGQTGDRPSVPGPDLLTPPPETPLLPNPLYNLRPGADPDEMRLSLEWPSQRYREEYGPRSVYLPQDVEIGGHILRRAAAGEAFGKDAGDEEAEIDDLVRRRVLLDLPEGL